MTEISYYERQQVAGETTKTFGIFGAEVDGGFRTTTDIPTAQGWGLLYGTKYLNDDATKDRVGRPWAIVEPAKWESMKRSAAQARKDYIAAQGTLSVGSVTVDQTEVLKALAALTAEVKKSSSAVLDEAARRLAS